MVERRGPATTPADREVCAGTAGLRGIDDQLAKAIQMARGMPPAPEVQDGLAVVIHDEGAPGKHAGARDRQQDIAALTSAHAKLHEIVSRRPVIDQRGDKGAVDLQLDGLRPRNAALPQYRRATPGRKRGDVVVRQDRPDRLRRSRRGAGQSGDCRGSRTSGRESRLKLDEEISSLTDTA